MNRVRDAFIFLIMLALAVTTSKASYEWFEAKKENQRLRNDLVECSGNKLHY
jgi:hypothetical protein